MAKKNSIKNECRRDCSACPFADKRQQASACIKVDVIGSMSEFKSLDFSTDDTFTAAYGDYIVRFHNLTGDDRHIGRRIIESNPDIVLNTVDSTRLEDSLRLTTRLIDMDSRVVLAFTRYDELLGTGHSLDFQKLGELFGFSALVMEEGREGLSRLLSAIVEAFECPAELKKHVHVPYGTDVDEAINEISEEIADSPRLSEAYHDRYLAVRMLEDSSYVYPMIEGDEKAAAIAARAAKLSRSLTRELGQTPEVLIRNARHGFIHGALQETLRHSHDNSDHTLLQKIDAILTSRWLGFPLMILILLGIFALTFSIGAYPQGWIESGVERLGEYLGGVMKEGWLSSLVVDGIVQGVGAVLAFLPNIVILFFFLSLLEDSGYMARAAFLMDKVMHRIGLHGRSFVPMLIGFGCNVPAIMAARSIEDRRDRTLTMLMIPYMSCSARLPVYLLFVSAFFVRWKALVMIGIYAAGIVLSILFAYVMKHTKFFRKEQDDYVSELPPFRLPTWRNTGLHIWERVSDYLQKITTVILTASVIIWALEFFPKDRTQGGVLKEESLLASIGRGLEPVTAPLGFDWRMNVCLLTGLPAKEAIVSTMGILYHSEDASSLAATMSKEGGISPASALAFMLFVLLYAPCLATLSAIRREAGRKWAVFIAIHSLAIAWIVAFLVNFTSYI